ncbi:hypothetical protein [Streptomyces chrestomyceticus]|uniref:hypothetical protein n=1 Tax=Streptomyces chrestomyceticus TaxID=68185 RepID=UPI0033FCC4B0
MSTTRRPLGHGPQHRTADPDAPAAVASGRTRIRAAQADMSPSSTFYQPAGQLHDELRHYRERGLLGPEAPRPTAAG